MFVVGLIYYGMTSTAHIRTASDLKIKRNMPTQIQLIMTHKKKEKLMMRGKNNEITKPDSLVICDK